MSSLLVFVIFCISITSASDIIRVGRSYDYDYTAVNNGELMGTTDSRSGFKFECQLTVYSPSASLIYMKIQSCTLYERKDNQYVVKEDSNTGDFNTKMTRFPVEIHLIDNYVKDKGLIFDKDEELEIRNIKRAIASAFQFTKHSDTHITLTKNDVYGKCRTKFINKGGSIRSERDLTHCEQPGVRLSQFKLHSHIQQLIGGINTQDFIELIYPYQTEAVCDHHFKGYDLKKVYCEQDHKFLPFSNKDHDKLISFGMKVTQTLELVRTHRGYLNGVSGVKDPSGIWFEFEDKLAKDTTANAIFKVLSSMAGNFMGYNMKYAVRKYERLIDLTRRASESTIRDVFNKITNCNCAADRQATMSYFFPIVLKTCGSSECVSQLVRHYHAEKKGGKELQNFLIDMMMNHDPNEAALGHVLEMCKELRTERCLLMLSGMVRNYALKQTNDVIQDSNKPMYKTMEFIRDIIGDKCEVQSSTRRVLPSTPKQQRAEIMTAIKSIGNLGHVTQIYDETSAKPIVPAVLECIKNEKLNEHMVKAAILSLQKMTIRDDITNTLLPVLKDVKLSVALQSTAFVVLMRDERRSTIDQLLDEIINAKSTNMKNFMVSFVTNFLQSQEPSYKERKRLWNEAFEDKKQYLPELDDLMFHKSRYTEMSRLFTLPLSQKNVGIQIALTVVYEPGNILPRSAVVNASLTFQDKTVNIIEAGVDMLGMESVLESFVGNKMFANMTMKDKLLSFASLAGQNMEALRKEALEAKEAQKAIEKYGIFEEKPSPMERLFEAFPDFDPSNVPPKMDIVPYLKRALAGGLPLPSNIDRNKLRQVLADIDSDAQGGIDELLTPAQREIFDRVLFKPKYNHVNKLYRDKSKKMFEEVNYPKLSLFNGMYYIKTLGNEIQYMTFEEIVQKILPFLSTDAFLKYINYEKLLKEFSEGKKFKITHFHEIFHKYRVIPSIIGVPINITAKATHGGLVDGRTRVLIDLKPQDSSVSMDGFVRRNGYVYATGYCHSRVPTRQESVGISMKAVANLYMKLEGGINYIPVSFKNVREPKKVVLTINNYKKPTEIFGLRSHIHIKHWNNEEEVTGRPDMMTKYETCSTPLMESIAGRKACWKLSYPNASEADDLPHFPLTGPARAVFEVTPETGGASKYEIVVEFSKKPCPHHTGMLLDSATLQYAAKDDQGNAGTREVKIDSVKNRKTGEFDIKITSPIYDGTEVSLKYEHKHPESPETKAPVGTVYHHAPKDNTMRKDLIFSVVMDGRKEYGLNYYRMREVKNRAVTLGGQRLMIPTTTYTLYGNYSMPGMSMDATIKHERVGRASFKTSLKAFYFCDMKDTPLYKLHLNPQKAEANGHLTDFSVEQGFEILNVKDPNVNMRTGDSLVVTYPGQHLEINAESTVRDGGRKILRTSKISYFDKNDVKQNVDVTLDVDNKGSVRGSFYVFDLAIDHIGKYNAKVEGELKFHYEYINLKTNLTYNKVQAGVRKRRSIYDYFRFYGDKMSHGLSYVKKGLSSVGSHMHHHHHKKQPKDDLHHDHSNTGVISWDSWTARMEFNAVNKLVYKPAPSGGYFDVHLDVHYPRNDRYHDLHFRTLYKCKKYSFRPGHGYYNMSLALKSTYLEKEFGMFGGYHGQPFGNDIHAFTQMTENNLATSERWTYWKTDYKRSEKHHVHMHHHFHTLRTNYHMMFHYHHYDNRTVHLNVHSSLKSSIAPPLEHKIQYIVTVDVENKVTKGRGKLVAKCSHFDYKRNSTWTQSDAGFTFNADFHEILHFINNSNVAGDAELKIMYPNKYLTFKSKGNNLDTGTVYFLEANTVNPKQFEINYYRQESGSTVKTNHLFWTLHKISMHQVKNVFIWSPYMNKRVQEIGCGFFKFLAKRYSNMAITMLSNLNKKSIWEKEVLYTNGMTVGDIYDKHMKPRWDSFVNRLSGYTIWGQSLGSKLKETVANIRAVKEHSMKMFKNSAFAKTMKKISPMPKVMKFFGKFLPELIKYWQKHRPRMLSNYWDRAYGTKLRKIFQDRKYTMIATHPFIMKSFVEPPTVRRWARSFVAWVRHVSHRNHSHRGLEALTFSKGHVYTFGGRIYDYPYQDRTQRCAYLLSSDFKYAQYSILKRNEDILFTSDDVKFTIKDHKDVHLNDASNKLDLPYYCPVTKTKIYAKAAFIKAKIPKYGITILCNGFQKICRYWFMNRHYNHTLGLLGRNDEEIVTDCNLPSGETTDNVHNFVNKYEMSGQCSHDPMTFVPVSKRAQCSQPSDICNYFDGNSPSLKKCSKYFDPLEFKKTCVAETTLCENQRLQPVACRIVLAYIELCKSKRIWQIEYPPECVQCGQSNMNSPPRKVTVQNTADYVFIVSRSSNMGAGIDDPFPKYISDFVDKIHIQGSRYALITFGKHSKKVHGDGTRPWSSSVAMKELVNKITFDYGEVKPCYSLKATKLASQLHYRPDAHRIVILIADIYHHDVIGYKHTEYILRELKKNSIVFNAFTRYDHTYSDVTFAINKHSSSDRVFLPKDEIGELVKETGGYLFHRASLSAKTSPKSARLIKSQVLRYPSPCRECKCVPSWVGEGMTVCSATAC